MWIKTTDRPSLTKVVLSHIANIRMRYYFIFSTIFFIAIISGVGGIYYGTTLMGSSYGSIFASFYRYFRPSLNIISHTIQGIRSSPDRLYIDMSHLDYEKLSHQVFNAKERGFITQDEKSVEVNASIRYNVEEHNVKVRLRGSFIEHVRDDKWSFRIKVKNGSTIDGMSRFSLSSPELRNHIHEWLFQRNLMYENLINLRYKFVQVYLNGKKLGIYALEEFFDKRLIENNNMREGLILRPDDLNEEGKPFLYQASKILKDSSKQAAYNKVIDRIDEYKRMKVPASTLYDVTKSAKYFAVATLYGGQHGHLKENYACYLNPVTNLLEPIGYDSNVSRVLSRYGGMIESPNNAYHSSIFVDESTIPYLYDSKQFKMEYMDQLSKMIQPNYFDEYFNAIEIELEESLGILYSEYPYFDYFERNYIINNIEYVNRQLYSEKLITASVISSNDNGINVYVDNIRDLPIIIREIVSSNSTKYDVIEREVIHSTINSGRHIVRFKQTEFSGEVPVSGGSHYLLYNVVGCDSVLTYEFGEQDNLAIVDIQHSKKVVSFDARPFNKAVSKYLIYDDSSLTIALPQGTYKIAEDLIIRGGYTFIIGPGTVIDLIESSKIVSYSPVRFIGDPSSKILFTSTDSTGQGIVVLNATDRSKLSYVSFHNLSSVLDNGWQLTGAVTFYESDVDITHSSFVDNSSEDALNIIRSDFNINYSLFKNIYSDAFDGDFVNGQITHSKFISCRNDGIDISGSDVTLEHIVVGDCGDKGISAGERSILRGNNIAIKNTEIGIASKDNSEVRFENVSTVNVKVDATAFKKKSEYGSSTISVHGYKSLDSSEKFIIEIGSQLNVNSNIVSGEEQNVEAMLYGNIYGRSSK